MSDFLEGNFINVYQQVSEEKQELMKKILKDEDVDIITILDNIDNLKSALIENFKKGKLRYENVNGESRFTIIEDNVETEIKLDNTFESYFDSLDNNLNNDDNEEINKQ